MLFIQSVFKIKRFTSSKDRDFIKALKIYNDSIAVHSKTDTNEISTFVDKKEIRNREMFFFGLYYNDEVVGYIECGYLKITRALMIDYIIIKDDYNYNGIFYPFFSLLQQFFSNNLIEIDYYLTEVCFKSMDYNEDKESYYLRKLLFAEDFKIINFIYPQPKLGLYNYESNLDMKIMIKSTNTMTRIKTETLMAILKDIYYNHYLDWYKEFMSNEELEEYKLHLQNQEKKIYDQIHKEKDIDLIISADIFCDYYLSNNCYYKSTKSMAGYVKSPIKKSTKYLKLLGIPLVIILALIFSFVVYILAMRLKMPLEGIAPFFSAISATLTGLIVLFASNKNK